MFIRGVLVKETSPEAVQVRGAQAMSPLQYSTLVTIKDTAVSSVSAFRYNENTGNNSHSAVATSLHLVGML
jgi:hypothetical protein